MNHHFPLRALALACILAGTAALCNAEIVKCIDDMGRMTLTDGACQRGPAQVDGEPAPDAHVSAPASDAPAPASANASGRGTRASAAVLDAHGAQQRESNTSLGGDVATLKAAKSALMAMDESRHRNLLLAGLR